MNLIYIFLILFSLVFASITALPPNHLNTVAPQLDTEPRREIRHEIYYCTIPKSTRRCYYRYVSEVEDAAEKWGKGAFKRGVFAMVVTVGLVKVTGPIMVRNSRGVGRV
ncbi:Protein of unknown function [Pyronema omphalodes CBS 100304]|uniref:Uncharacterized protein n=1 Tax=Pyronema omphalodes (strain CBS 100304) TaxID=1076935 RepID=U4LHG8_PYROM|nr:Protein of unknown function [Pyronema omphalodes CBS 100304]